MSTMLSEKFKQLRSSTGLNQVDFAELLGIPPSTYKKNEQGKTEISLSTVLAITNHEQFKQHTLWLLNDEIDLDKNQFSPGGDNPIDNALSEQEYEEKFVKVVADTLIMFCVLDWFTPNKEKGISFDDCAKLLFKDLKPVISERFTETDISQTKTA